jgi:hypothetical protein
LAAAFLEAAFLAVVLFFAVTLGWLTAGFAALAFLLAAFSGFTAEAAFFRVLVLLAAAVDLLVAGMIKSCVVGIKPKDTENRSPITVDIVTVEITRSSNPARIVRA